MVNRKAIVKKIFAAALSVTLVFTGTMSTLSRAVSYENEYLSSINLLGRVTRNDIEKAKRERDYARKQAQRAKTRISDLNKKKSSLQGDLKDLSLLSYEQKVQYETISGQLQSALDAKAEALDRFIAAQENLTKRKTQFEERVKAMFEFQNKSTLELMLESDSIAGFFTNLELMSLIADADSQVLDDLQIALDDAQLTADSAMDEASEMQEIADAKQKELNELESRIGVTTKALDNVSTQITSEEKLLDELNGESDKISQKVKELEKEYYKQNYTPPSNNGGNNNSGNSGSSSGSSGRTSGGGSTKTVSGVTFSWPTASHKVTSSYGYRIHPISHVKKFHKGIDIGGVGYGGTIAATASGRVILVNLPVPGRNTGGSGYGNYCIIDHGNGITSLYAHCRNIFVKKGQTVSRGQKIAECGSTGGSTGPHLHFEIRVNGNTRNPRNYLP